MFASRPWRKFSVTATGGLNVNSSTWLLGSTVRGRYSTANVSVSYDGAATLEYGWLSRSDDGDLAMLRGTQRGLRATGAYAMGALTVSGGVERGRVEDNRTPTAHDYTLLSLSLSADVGSRLAISVFGAHNEGENLTGAGNGVVNAGASLHAQLPFSLTFSLASSAQRATLGVLNSSGAWFSQSDARLDYRFSNGSSLGIRERVWQNPTLQGSFNANAMYLEYRTPLRIPVGPLRSRGRVVGRVTRAETGAPLGGVAVRLGDYAAVTDRDGRATFQGLDPALYHVMLDATGPAAGAVLSGNVTVDLRESPERLSEFSVAVSRGARVGVLLRRLVRAAGTIGVHSDSLVSAGGLANVLVTLAGARDTIYRSSDEQGRVDFGAVTPGAWTLVVRPADLPEHSVLDVERVAVILAAGEQRVIEFRIVPQRRAVTFIEGESPPAPLPPKPGEATPHG